MTYSIVACDDTHMGVATASHWLGVGALVPWVRAGVGVIATQAFTNVDYGPTGLDALAAGQAPEDVLQTLLAADAGRDFRQVLLLDTHGRTAAATGANCLSACTSLHASDIAVGGNMLASEQVPAAMRDAFRQHAGTLASRLLGALRAGQDAGGDVRGRQAAAIKIVMRRPAQPTAQPVVDLRVDDHAAPLDELERLYALQKTVEAVAAESFPALGNEAHARQAVPASARLEALTELAARMRPTGNPEAALWLALACLQAGDKTRAQAALAAHPHLWPVVQRWHAAMVRANATDANHDPNRQA